MSLLTLPKAQAYLTTVHMFAVYVPRSGSFTGLYKEARSLETAGIAVLHTDSKENLLALFRHRADRDYFRDWCLDTYFNVYTFDVGTQPEIHQYLVYHDQKRAAREALFGKRS